MISESIDIEAESGRFINRELSWLEFNSRVLAQAEDPALPLLERVKFCAIWCSNLDSLTFMTRRAGWRAAMRASAIC